MQPGGPQGNPARQVYESDVYPPRFEYQDRPHDDQNQVWNEQKGALWHQDAVHEDRVNGSRHTGLIKRAAEQPCGNAENYAAGSSARESDGPRRTRR